MIDRDLTRPSRTRRKVSLELKTANEDIGTTIDDHHKRETIESTPWTVRQQIICTCLLVMMIVTGLVYIHFMNKEMTRTIDPTPNGNDASVILFLTAFAYFSFSTIVCWSLRRWHENFHTLKAGISSQSAPYQFAIGALALLYIYSWLGRMEHTSVVDIRHCKFTGDNGKKLFVVRLRSPTSINWTAVNICNVDQIGKAGEEIINPVILPDGTLERPPAASWYVYDGDDRLKSWKQHLLDLSLTLIFGLHIALSFFFSLVDGIYGFNKVKFSWFAPFANTMHIIDFIVVCGTLVSMTSDNHIYDVYGVAGCFRFLLLGHPLFCLEYFLNQRKQKKKYGVCSRYTSLAVAAFKLLFVCLVGAGLIMMAEKPCEIVLDDYRNQNGSCDPSFNSFGSVVYFTFVTLSTVGYGDMAPKTPLGQTLIIFIILFGISYLPGEQYLIA